MAVQDLGSKIMIHKVTEYSKEVSSLLKSGELAQSGIHAKAIADAQREQEQIQDIFEPSDVEIRRERERKRREGDKKHEEHKKAQDDNRGSSMLLKDEPRKIDIEILNGSLGGRFPRNISLS